MVTFEAKWRDSIVTSRFNSVFSYETQTVFFFFSSVYAISNCVWTRSNKQETIAVWRRLRLYDSYVNFENLKTASSKPCDWWFVYALNGWAEKQVSFQYDWVHYTSEVWCANKSKNLVQMRYLLVCIECNYSRWHVRPGERKKINFNIESKYCGVLVRHTNEESAILAVSFFCYICAMAPKKTAHMATEIVR